MKALEEKFFKYCCKNLKHSKENSNLKVPIISFRNDLSMFDIVDKFVNKYYYFDDEAKQNGIRNRLWYYINKWDQKGMLEYGVSIGTAWFQFDSKTGVNLNQYVNIIPSRILSHNADLRKFVREYKENRKFYLKTIVQ